MYIRKRSFFEIILPLTIVTFVCLGTRFIDAIGSTELRWVFDLLLLLYLFLNKKLLAYIHPLWRSWLIIYLAWCVSTTVWSQIPILSFSKSSLFALNTIIMISAGSWWVIKFGFERSLDWLFLVLVVALASGFLGSSSTGTLDANGNFNAYNVMYSGLSGSANAFAFLVVIATPLILWKLYQHKRNRKLLLIWLIVLGVDTYFLLTTYSRGSIAIFICVLAFFVLSFPLSKKIFISFLSFFCIVITLIMMPVSYFENMMDIYVFKYNGTLIDPNSSRILQSRSLVWKKSYQQAIKGGVVGGGFFVTIGDKNFSDEDLSDGRYGREKGNAQFAIMEETGIIGLLMYAVVLISLFSYVIPYYLRFKGSKRVAMGIVLGTILGLLMESIVEAWWDSAAGPELICFWTLVGVMFGMIYLERKKLRDAEN